MELAPVDFGPPAPPVNISPLTSAKQFGFLTAPPGWYGDWHPTPKRQVFFYLSGEIEGQATDGELRRFAPGSVTLLESSTGKSHTSRVVGAEDVLLAVVQLED